ncbi:MAG: DUF4198 domain-containing protein [Pseudomonadota bacterium]
MRLLFWLVSPMLVLSSAAMSHEFWIEPEDYMIEPGQTVKANLKNGQDFKGGRLPWLDRRFDAFQVSDADGVRDLTGTNGNLPAIETEAADGLMIFAYDGRPETLTFVSFEKFANYVRYEGLDWAVAAHQDAGLPDKGFKELYRRNAKSLVQVGPFAGGADKAMGLKFELVVDGSPYAPGATEVAVILLLDGKPVADWPINVFTRTDDPKGALTMVHTGDDGRAIVPFPEGAEILLNSVWLELVEGKDYAWESWWASTTFGRPKR